MGREYGACREYFKTTSVIGKCTAVRSRGSARWWTEKAKLATVWTIGRTKVGALIQIKRSGLVTRRFCGTSARSESSSSRQRTPLKPPINVRFARSLPHQALRGYEWQSFRH